MKKEKLYEVYKIVNKINGRVYVGITNQGYKTRWYKHCSDSIHGCSYPLHCALRKHGTDNFIVEVIEICPTIENLKEREQYWIKELKSLTTENGYNLTLGGEGTFGRFHSEETKNKIRQRAFGRKASDQSKLIMSLASHKSKKISMFTLDGELIKTFRSASEAAKEIGAIRTNVAACARGKYKQSKGYKFSYTDFVVTDPVPEIKNEVKLKEKIPMSDEIKKCISETNKLRWNDERRLKYSLNNIKNRQILQYDLESNFIREFRNVSEAVKLVGASTHTNIAKCARGIRKSSCGFIWKYKDLINEEI